MVLPILHFGFLSIMAGVIAAAPQSDGDYGAAIPYSASSEAPYHSASSDLAYPAADSSGVNYPSAVPTEAPYSIANVTGYPMGTGTAAAAASSSSQSSVKGTYYSSVLLAYANTGSSLSDHGIASSLACASRSTITVTASEQVTVTVTPSMGRKSTKISSVSAAPEPLTYPQGGAASPSIYSTNPKRDDNPVYSPAASNPTSKEVSPATYISTSKPQPTNISAHAKRGLAYNDVTLTHCFQPNPKISWAYNWAHTPSNGLPSTLEYVPCLWGPRPMFTTGWPTAAQAALDAGSTHLLAFNEPDHPAQANLSPQEAASAWKLHMQPFAGKAKLGSPAVTNGPSPMGLAWLAGFAEACVGCTVDFYVVHWYDAAGQVDKFKEHCRRAHELTGKPIWVTEFGATGGEREVEAFLREVLPWLDGQDYVERYAYFMVSEGVLVSGGGMSGVGEVYATFDGKEGEGPDY